MQVDTKPTVTNQIAANKVTKKWTLNRGGLLATVLGGRVATPTPESDEGILCSKSHDNDMIYSRVVGHLTRG